MAKKIIRRFLLSLLVLVGVTIIAFGLVRLTPGDPAEVMLGTAATPELIAELNAKMGLDKPLVVQYFVYIGNVLKGDLGFSYFLNMDCASLIFGRLPATARLSAASFVILVVISFPLGILAGIKKGSIIDSFAIFVALLGQSISPVWLGLLMILFFGVQLGWLPVQGHETFKHIIMPAIVMGFSYCSLTTNLLRSGMSDVLQQDYITATRARGISRMKIYTKYALKNALLPIITIMGNNIGGMLAGSVVIETIFNWPGFGDLAVRAVNNRDYQLVQSVLLITACIFVICNVLVDVLYCVVDKRIEFN